MPSRRDFLRVMGVLTVAGALPRQLRGQASQPAFHFSHKAVPGGGLVIGSLNDGGNVLVMPSQVGPIIIDAKFAHTADDLLADVKSHIGKPPSLLINTHHHADHSGGNWAFRDVAEIIAHKNLNPRLDGNLPRLIDAAQGRVNELREQNADQRKIDAAEAMLAKVKSLTGKDFAAERELSDAVTILDLTDAPMEVRHYGNGHTDNDLVIFFPRQNVMHMGDLLFHNLHPFIDRSAKADTAGWQNSLREAMKLGDDKAVVIPGHGEVTDKTALPRMIEYFDQLRAVVEKAMKEGKSKETISAMKPEQFKDRGFEMLQARALATMYDEISESMH